MDQFAHNYSLGRSRFYFTDPGIIQKKNAGDLKVIRNDQVPDSIISVKRIQHADIQVKLMIYSFSLLSLPKDEQLVS